MASQPRAPYRARFWGVRGSIPCPGTGTAKYGGNTSCIQVLGGQEIIVLDAGTGIRRTRLGFAITYLGSDVEGSLSIEQTVSAAGGLVPVATVFRIVMRTSRWPF